MPPRLVRLQNCSAGAVEEGLRLMSIVRQDGEPDDRVQLVTMSVELDSLRDCAANLFRGAGGCLVTGDVLHEHRHLVALELRGAQLPGEIRRAVDSERVDALEY